MGIAYSVAILQYLSSHNPQTIGRVGAEGWVGGCQTDMAHCPQSNSIKMNIFPWQKLRR